jgi:hypothetical protein
VAAWKIGLIAAASGLLMFDDGEMGDRFLGFMGRSTGDASTAANVAFWPNPVLC